MKKRNCVCAAAAISCFLIGSIALGASVDVTSMSLDELVEMRAVISEEINERIGSDSEVINQGNYLVGKDIMAGAYVLTAMDKSVSIGILRDQKALEEKDESALISDLYLTSGESGNIFLESGNVLMIKDSSAQIRENMASWIPEDPMAMEAVENETE